jgi:hypothetical protein
MARVPIAFSVVTRSARSRLMALVGVAAAAVGSAGVVLLPVGLELQATTLAVSDAVNIHNEVRMRMRVSLSEFRFATELLGYFENGEVSFSGTARL